MNLAYIPSPGFSKFSIGPVTIHMYAICILTGIIFAVWILTVRWKKNGGTFDQVLLEFAPLDDARARCF